MFGFGKTIETEQAEYIEPAYIKYAPTGSGYDECVNADPVLAETARSLILGYLAKEFPHTEEQTIESLHEAIDYVGFRIKVVAIDDKTWSYEHYINGADDALRYARLEMFKSFKKEINSIPIDLSDGWKDEAVVLINIVNKYKTLLAPFKR